MSKSAGLNMNDVLKCALLIGGITLLAACGSQVNDAESMTTKSSPASINSTSAVSSQLLTSLAATYPNGKMPEDLKSQAAKALAQNPAVLKMSASGVASVDAKSNLNSGSKAQATETDTGSYSPVYRIQNTSLPGSYFFTIYDTERQTALQLNPRWKLEGAAFYTATGTADGLSPVYRFRNKTNGSYIYTIYESEYQSLLDNYSATFVLEGVSWYARLSPAPGYTPLYRFRNKTNGTYLFSAYEGEMDAIVANYSAIFELEGISYYVNTTDTNPDCAEKLPEKTLATLPASYSAKLLDSSFNFDKVFLTNTGYVAWRAQSSGVCSSASCYGMSLTGVKLYDSVNDILRIKAATSDPLHVISLNDAGVVLMGESSMTGPNQWAEISTLPLAKLWDGVTTVDSVVRAAGGSNHRAGRHTFSMPTGGVTDGSGRKWGYPNSPSYLDNAKLVNSTTAFGSGGNFPGGVNHCGTAVENYGLTKYGLYFYRGTVPVNTVGMPLSADSAAFPRITVNGLTNTGTTFGTLNDGNPMSQSPILGFIRSTTNQRYYPDSVVNDANDADTGVGNKFAPMTVMGISVTTPTEGLIMAADGAKSLKSLVPSLAASNVVLTPQAINNRGQIVTSSCIPSSTAACSPTGNLYLLTPQ